MKPLAPLLLVVLLPNSLQAAPLTVDDCVAKAMQSNADLLAAKADAAGARAQVAQIEALLYPKLSARGFLAPLFRAKGGLGVGGPYKNNIKQWGPYAHIEGQIFMPLTTFGRYTAGHTAAEERAGLAQEYARQVAHKIRFEVRKLYGLRLFALSMLPSLDMARKLVQEAGERAQELYDNGTGEVSQADLMRLRYGGGEVRRRVRQAKDGAALATLALKQMMGLTLDADVTFAGDRLRPSEQEVQPLEKLIAAARGSRPELAQIEHGKAATKAWQQAEEMANYPTLFVAALGRADWSPVRPKGSSSIFYNNFNDYGGGVALGLDLNVDAALVSAKAAEAHAKGEWVEATAAMAETGVPMQVWKAHQAVRQHHDLSKVAKDQVTSTRKWMIFSATAYAGGTGEAKDVLEGAAAYMMAKYAYYEHLLGAWEARAELEMAVGASIGSSDAE